MARPVNWLKVGIVLATTKVAGNDVVNLIGTNGAADDTNIRFP